MASVATRVKVAVIVHPNSRHPRVEIDQRSTLHVYVRQPPHEGKANEAVGEALAAHFGTRRGKVTLLSGVKSRSKVYEIAEVQVHVGG